MFPVNRLRIDGRLAKTVTISHLLESMISIARTTNRKRHPLARRPDGVALDRRWHAQTPNGLSSHQGPQSECPTSSPHYAATPTPIGPPSQTLSYSPSRVRPGSPPRISEHPDS